MGHSIKRKWEIIKCQHAPGIKSSQEWNLDIHLFLETLSPLFSHLLVFQETAAALTGVTTAHAAHFPSLLTSGDGSPGGQGRRSRPLPAHLASTAPYMGSPFNRRTHKCDYPDCDKVMGLKDSISILGTDPHPFYSQFGFCPVLWPALLCLNVTAD